MISALRLGGKYFIRQARADAVRRLKAEFTIWYGEPRQCICGRECTNQECSPLPQSEIVLEVGERARWKLLDAFAVARAHGLLHLLPMIFEKIAANMEATGDNQNRDFMLEGWRRDDGTSTDMCIEDKLLCLNGLRAIQMARISTWGSLRIPSARCTSVGHCTNSKDGIVASLAQAPSFKPRQDIVDSMCTDCKQLTVAAFETWDSGNRDALPGWLNLPTWRDLLRCRDETFVSPPLPQPTISFSDGTILLNVDGKQFRVHAGILGQYTDTSQFRIPRGGFTSSPSIVQLHGDRGRDWEYVLRWMYDHRYEFITIKKRNTVLTGS